MSPASRHLWRALIRRSLRLRAAYLRAAAAVDEPGLRSVLAESAQMLDQLIAEWRMQCREPMPRPRWLEIARRRVDAWRWRAMPRSDVLWIRLLARDEAALLHTFELALAAASGDLAPLLYRQRSRLDAIHRDMRSLAQAVGH